MTTEAHAIMDQAQQRYRHLIDAICRSENIPNPEALYDNCRLAVNQVTFAMLHNAELDPHHVVLMADFGEPPADRIGQVLRRLMEVNFFTYTDMHGPSFTMHAESGHVWMMTRVALDKATAESIRFLITSIVDQVSLWRKGFYLDLDTESPAVTS